MIQNGGVDQRWNRVSDFDRVESRVSVRSVFDQVLSFNMRVYRGIVSTE